MPSSSRDYPVGSMAHVFNRGVEKRLIFMDDLDRERFLSSLLFYQAGFTGLSFFLQSIMQREGVSRPAFKLLYDYWRKKQGEMKAVVKVLAFALVDNHFHLLLHQVVPDGIALFMQRLGNSFTKYFNTRHARKGLGSLFQARYKSVLIETEEQLLHVSRYIHLQAKDLAPPEKQKERDELLRFIRRYNWNSYRDYVGLRNREEYLALTEREPILSYFETSQWKRSRAVSSGHDFSYQTFVESYLEMSDAGIQDLKLE